MPLITLGLACLLLLSASESRAETAEKTKFLSDVAACLKKPQLDCLEAFIGPKMYFPEQTDFRCTTADEEHHWYITPKEFATCAQQGETKYEGCGDKPLTLREVLRACFVDPKAKRRSGSMRSVTGYLCHYGAEEGKFLIQHVACSD